MHLRKKNFLAALIPFTYLFLLLFRIDFSMSFDLPRHLKMGQIIVHCFCVPETNLFSYPNISYSIVNHEWLAEVIFYLTSLWFGLNGLLILKIVCIIFTASLLYIVALKKGSLFWITIFSLLSIQLFSMRLFVLPELFSYLFIGVFIFIIEKSKERKNKSWLWLLPILEVLWVNMHIYFIIGIVLYGFFFLEDLIAHKKVDNKLLLIGVTLVFATLLNPSFVQGAILPFTFQQSYNFPVEENESPFYAFNSLGPGANINYIAILEILVFELYLGIFVVGLFFKKQWKEIFHTGSALTAALLAIRFMRCIGLFGMLGFIPLVQTFTYAEKQMKSHLEGSTMNIIKGFVVIVVVLIVGINIKGLFDYHTLYFGFQPSAENAIVFMEKNHIKGRYFNNYVMGNFLTYAFYPPAQVYVDPRPEDYPKGFMNDYWKMMSNNQFFNQQVNLYHINAVVFNIVADNPSITTPFLTRLYQSKQWILVYGDGTITILVKNDKENQEVIKKFAIHLQS